MLTFDSPIGQAEWLRCWTQNRSPWVRVPVRARLLYPTDVPNKYETAVHYLCGSLTVSWALLLHDESLETYTDILNPILGLSSRRILLAVVSVASGRVYSNRWATAQSLCAE